MNVKDRIVRMRKAGIKPRFIAEKLGCNIWQVYKTSPKKQSASKAPKATHPYNGLSGVIDKLKRKADRLYMQADQIHGAISAMKAIARL